MWKEPFSYVADFLPLAAGTGVAYTDFPIKTFDKYDYEIIRTIYQATDGRINVRMTNNTTGHDIIRPQGDIRAVSSTAFSGIAANGFTPFNFAVPYKVSGGTELVVSASDKSGAPNRLRFAIHGNKIYPGDAPYQGRVRKETFSFTLDSGSLAAYGQAVIPFRFNSNYGFLAAKITGVATGTGLVFIEDATPWQSRDIHFYNMVGNAQFGHHLTSRKWMPDKSVLTVRFTDISGSTNRMRITFHGEKVFSE